MSVQNPVTLAGVNYGLPAIAEFGNQAKVGDPAPPYEVQTLANGGTVTPPTPVVRTATLTDIVATTTGSSTAGIYRVFFFNNGTADILVDGNVVKAGQTVSFDADESNTLAAITYDSQTSTILIGEVA